MANELDSQNYKIKPCWKDICRWAYKGCEGATSPEIFYKGKSKLILLSLHGPCIEGGENCMTKFGYDLEEQATYENLFNQVRSRK